MSCMDSLIAQNPILNSQFLNTLVSGILALMLLLVTIVTAFRQQKLERHLQEKSLLSDREEKILDIFNTYAECGRVFNTWFSYENVKVLIIPDKYEADKFLNQSVLLNKSFNEAKLIFERNSLIVKRLKFILHKYERLRREERAIARSQYKKMVEAFEIVKAKYPEYNMQFMNDILFFDDAREEYRKLVKTEKLNKFELALDEFIKKDLSDKGFDDYFKPFVNLMTDREIKSSNKEIN